MNAGFTINSIFKRIDEFKNSRIKKAIDTLSYAGEEFVKAANLVDTYKDRTGNLRASIGYVVLHDGKDVFKKTTGAKDDGGKGKAQAQKMTDEFARKFNKGLVLVCFAGMEYAAAVEALNYDVITGSVPLANNLIESFKRYL